MTKAKRVAVAAASAAIAAVIAAGVWIGVGGSGGTESGSSSFLISGGTENGISLMSYTISADEYASYGISSEAESAQKITATVNSDATNKNVTFTAAWANAASSWATGKTVSDYVVIYQETGSLEAVVACMQAFGEQAVITATSESNPEITATATCDYVKRASVTLGLSGTTVTITDGGTITIAPAISFGVGTITPDVTYSDVSYGITATAAAAAGEYYLGDQTVGYSATMNVSMDELFGTMFADSAASRYYWVSAQTAEVTFTMQYVLTYDGNTYSTETVTETCTFSFGAMDIPVTNITIDGNLVF